jgi:hypothetical protein
VTALPLQSPVIYLAADPDRTNLAGGDVTVSLPDVAGIPVQLVAVTTASVAADAATEYVISGIVEGDDAPTTWSRMYAVVGGGPPPAPPVMFSDIITLADATIQQVGPPAGPNIVIDDADALVTVRLPSLPGEQTYVSARSTQDVAVGVEYAISGTLPGATAPTSWPAMYVSTPGGITTAAGWTDLPPDTTPVLTPPGMLQYWVSGFNMAKFSFTDAQIFIPSYTNPAHRASFGGYSATTYQFPDHIDFTLDNSYYMGESKTLLRTEADFNWTYTLSLQSSVSEPMVASVKDSTTFTYKGDLFTEQAHTYDQIFRIFGITDTKVDLSYGPLDLPLVPAFFEQLANLAAVELTPTTQIKWNDFFDTWGTHYLASGKIGGYIVFTCSIDNTIFKTVNDTSLATTLTTTATDELATKTCDKTTFDSMLNTSNKAVAEATNTTIFIVGGTPNTNTDLWANSVWNAPLLLFGIPNTDDGNPVYEPPVFMSFAAFLSDSTEQARVDAATIAYAGVGSVTLDVDGFSSLQMSQPDVAVAATQDLFVLASSASNNEISILADSSVSPTAQIAVTAGYNSLLVPVRAGQTYACRTRDTSSQANPPAPVIRECRTQTLTGPPRTLFGVPNTPALTPPAGWTVPEVAADSWALEVDTPFTTTSPGMFVLWWESPLVKMWSDHAHPPPISAWLTAADASYTVGAGVTYMVDGADGDVAAHIACTAPLEPGDYTFTAHVWFPYQEPISPAQVMFVPFGSGLSFGPRQSLAWNEAYVAASDGLCVATATPKASSEYEYENRDVNAYENGAVDFAIQVGQTAQDVLLTQGGSPAGPASAGVWFGTQTIVLPIQQGSYYAAQMSGPLDPLNGVWFLPISWGST